MRNRTGRYRGLFCFVGSGGAPPAAFRHPVYHRGSSQDSDRSPCMAAADLSAFPITRKWPAQRPERLQLYSLNTPNGIKVSHHAGGTGLPLRAASGALRQAMTRPRPSSCRSTRTTRSRRSSIRTGPGGKPLALFESGANPDLPRPRRPASSFRSSPAAPLRDDPVAECSRWAASGRCSASSASSTSSPARDYEDKRPRDRYVAESARLLGVLDNRLEGPRLGHG